LTVHTLLTDRTTDLELPALSSLDFDLPPELEADEPPEARGLKRDEVRLMVSYSTGDRVVHSRFRDLGDFLEPGDVLVLITSGPMNAALGATREDGTELELHLSTHLPADLWIVEVRRPDAVSTRPFYNAAGGETLRLASDATATLYVPYARDRHLPLKGYNRLWIATFRLPVALDKYLARHGFPIRYDYVKEAWPASYYQTVYATEVGSAEMPSAGRAFTSELIT